MTIFFTQPLPVKGWHCKLVAAKRQFSESSKFTKKSKAFIIRGSLVGSSWVHTSEFFEKPKNTKYQTLCWRIWFFFDPLPIHGFNMKTNSVLFIIAVVKFIYSEKPHKLKEKSQSTLDLTDQNSYFNMKLERVGIFVLTCFVLLRSSKIR